VVLSYYVCCVSSDDLYDMVICVSHVCRRSCVVCRVLCGVCCVICVAYHMVCVARCMLFGVMVVICVSCVMIWYV